MEKAKIAIIEDYEPMRLLAKTYLEMHDHIVVGEAGSRSDAIGLVDSIANGYIPTDVILLDGNLTPNTRNFSDASAIVERIKELGVLKPILGFSSESLLEHGIDVIADTYKDMDRLINAIKRLNKFVI